MQSPRMTATKMVTPTSSVQAQPERRTSFTKAFQFFRPQTWQSSRHLTILVHENSEVSVYSSSLKGLQQPMVNMNRRPRLSLRLHSNSRTHTEECSGKIQEDNSTSDIDNSKSGKIRFNPCTTIYITKHAPITDTEKRRMFYCSTDYQRMLVDGLRCIAEERNLVQKNLSDKFGGSEFSTVRGLESAPGTTVQKKSTEQKQAIMRAVLNEQSRQRQYRVSDTANIAKVAIQVSRFDVRKAIENAQKDARAVCDSDDEKKDTNTKELYKGKRRRSTSNIRTVASILSLENRSNNNLSTRSHCSLPNNASQKAQSRFVAKDATVPKLHDRNRIQDQDNTSPRKVRDTSFSFLSDESRDCNGKVQNSTVQMVEKQQRMEI
jgi:hypothetical protein